MKSIATTPLTSGMQMRVGHKLEEVEEGEF
jgi:hypothetical protein